MIMAWCRLRLWLLSDVTQQLTCAGAVVCRVAPSMLRFGSLELPFSRNEMDVLKQIVEYVISYHYPEFADLAWVSDACLMSIR